MGSAAEHQKLVDDTLTELAMHGYKAWLQNTGAAFRDGQFIRFGKKGGADIIIVGAPDGRHIEAEGKTGKAVQSKNQERHQAMIEKQGALYFLFRAKDDLIRQLTEAGYPPPK